MKQKQTETNKSIQYINSIIENSKYNRESKHQGTTLEIYEQGDREVIIKQSELNQLKMMMEEDYAQRLMGLQERQQEIDRLKQYMGKYEEKLQCLLQSQFSKNHHFKSKEEYYMKCIEELQAKYEAQRKKRDKIQKQLKWMNGKLKDQLKQNQIIKHKLNKKQQNGSTTKTELSYVFQSSNSDQKSVQQPTNGYETPSKSVSKKLDNLPAINCESIQYSFLHSDLANRQKIVNPMMKYLQTEQTKINEVDQTQHSGIVMSGSCAKSKLKQSYEKMSGEVDRMHRHSQIDKKDRIVKLLAQKCVKLQIQLQKMAQLIIGNKLDCKTTSSQILSSKQKYTKNSSECQLFKTKQDSQLQFSTIFKVQSQQF